MATVSRAVKQFVKTQTGTVISAGKMQKTITVRMKKQSWNTYLRKNYITHYNIFAHDPSAVAVIGDVVSIAPSSHSHTVRHRLSDIIAPFGIPLSDRPPLLTPDERGLEALAQKRHKEDLRKQRKQALKGKAVGDVVDLPGGVQIIVESVDKDGRVQKTRMIQNGREVLKDGKHKFGEINDEARKARAKADRLFDKASHNQRVLKEMEGDVLVKEQRP